MNNPKEEIQGVIDEYEKSAQQKMLDDLRSLKPNPFISLINVLVFLGFLGIATSIFDYQIEQAEIMAIFFPILIVSTMIAKESKRTNRRIDILVKLFEQKQS
jgi:hypothetical protein